MDFPANPKPSPYFVDRTGGNGVVGQLLLDIQRGLGWYAGGKVEDDGWKAPPPATTKEGDWPTYKPERVERKHDSEFYRKLERELGVRER